MFYTGLSGLNAAQAALVTTGHNTANVNTPGYSRQSVQIASSNGSFAPGVGFFGTGAKVIDVSRSYDQYLTSQLNSANSLNESLTTYSSQISQIDNLLANQVSGLAPQIQSLFTNVQAVANTPADPAARQQMISSGQAMSNQFRAMDGFLSGLREAVNSEISGSVDQINTYASQIAALNKQVALFTTGNGSQAPNDLLDLRDQLVSDLSKLVGTKLVKQDGGQYNLFIGNGQTLVLGDKATELTTMASSSDPTMTSVGFKNAAGVGIELKDTVISGGSIGGLMQFRSESLATAQNSLGRISIVMADKFNTQQKLGVDMTGAAGADFFTQATPNLISNARNSGNLVMLPTFSDASQLTTSDYRLDVTAGPSYSLTRLSDSKSIALSPGFPGAAPANTTTFDGVTLTFSGGAGAAGDSFLIQPTRTGARDMSVLIIDPAGVAAASPLITGNVEGNKGSGKISPGVVDVNYIATPLAAKVTLSFNGATNELTGFPAGASVKVTLANGSPSAGSPYAAGSPVPFTAGSSLTFNGITLNIGGAPANGDTFTIDKNTGGVSDGSNALLMGKLQNTKTIGGGSSSFNDAYAQLVSAVGNKARQLQISNTAQTSLAAQIHTSQQSVSGVNQDEETANLLMFQQMYQANAKVIQTASTIFDAVLGIHG